MFHNNTLISSQIVNKMAEILSKHFPDFTHLNTETNYCIAGGAVYSAFVEATNMTLTTRYKDLDVFVYRETNHDDEPFIARKPSNDTHTQCERSFLECRITSIPKDSYCIMTSTMKDDINTIEIDADKNNPTEFAKTVINAFDINNTQIAMYPAPLGGFDVIVTPAFIEFLSDHTLRATNYYTGAHTATRLIRKSQQLNLNVDQESIEKCLLGIDVVNAIAQTRIKEMNIDRKGTPGWMMAQAYQREVKQLELPIEFEQIECSNESETFYLGIPSTTCQHELSAPLIKLVINHISALGTINGLTMALNLLKLPTKLLKTACSSQFSDAFLFHFVRVIPLFEKGDWSKEDLMRLDEACLTLEDDAFTIAIEKIRDKSSLFRWLDLLLKRQFKNQQINNFSDTLLLLKENGDIHALTNSPEKQIERIIHTTHLNQLQPHTFLTGLKSDHITVLNAKQAFKEIHKRGQLSLSYNPNRKQHHTYTVFLYHEDKKSHLCCIDNHSLTFTSRPTSRFGTVTLVDGMFTQVQSFDNSPQCNVTNANTALNLAVNQINHSTHATIELAPSSSSSVCIPHHGNQSSQSQSEIPF